MLLNEKQKQITKINYDMILCACASDMYPLVRLEYFAWLDGGGGHQMYYDTVCELVNEVMFSDNSPYLNWVKQWDDGKGEDFNQMYGNCLDWYHMDLVRKLFIERYSDCYCEETKEEEVMEEIARLLLLVKSPKNTIKGAINFNIEKQYGIKTI